MFLDKTKIEGAYWLDPRNWYSFTGNEATPHVERLPCIFDIIEFPNSNEWFVILPNRNLSVQALVYDSYVSFSRFKFNFFYIFPFLFLK